MYWISRIIAPFGWPLLAVFIPEAEVLPHCCYNFTAVPKIPLFKTTAPCVLNYLRYLLRRSLCLF